MNGQAVYWHEGMFLRPHHFLAAQAHWADQAHRGEKWDHHHDWGLRSIALDLEALANSRIVVRSLKARLRDGTLIAIPEDGMVPPLEIKAAFGRDNTVTAFLALPVANAARANASTDGAGAAEWARYVVATQEVPDENTGANPQPVQFRRPNFRLLTSGQDQAGYDVLPIARFVKSPRAEATPQLDETYLPPMLACDAWPPLREGILQALYDRVGKKVEALATQVVSRGITFDSQAQGDPLIFAQLRDLDEAYPVLGALAFAEGVHPLWAYVELCRLVGRLSIFGATRRPPALPRYDHDDLGGCFYAAKRQIDAMLDVLVEPEYKEQPFIGAGMRMQVALEPAWLESAWQMYIGVLSPLDPEATIRLLTKPGQLDMKIGSSDRVDAIFRLGQAGLRFAHTPRPPRALPAMQGLIYFQVNRESEQAEWQNVQRSLSLAIRLNENLIAGNIQGQRSLAIRSEGQTTTLQFTLYVAPEGH